MNIDSFAQDEQVKATLKNGLLTVTFPKTLPELVPKKIVIQTSDKVQEEYDADF
jgi:HSP20 family molecular chaperone IbpA